MSERGNFRGGRGGGRGSDQRGGRGGPRGAGHGGSQAEKPKKENILDLTKYMDKEINVKFNGGREGTLKGYDQLMNLVLDDVKELLRDDDGNESSRPLGLMVARGTLLVLISPVDGSEQIENPFNVGEE
ncbi:Sm-like protein lsm7 [Bachmanniomyces sp. S44760]|nr:Sm-like protein lsm7 [Bachmanniomyces sp. S44760]